VQDILTPEIPVQGSASIVHLLQPRGDTPRHGPIIHIRRNVRASRRFHSPRRRDHSRTADTDPPLTLESPREFQFANRLGKTPIARTLVPAKMPMQCRCADPRAQTNHRAMIDRAGAESSSTSIVPPRGRQRSRDIRRRSSQAQRSASQIQTSREISRPIHLPRRPATPDYHITSAGIERRSACHHQRQLSPHQDTTTESRDSIPRYLAS